MIKYMLRNAIAFDQLINTLVGGFPNETLSARAWRQGDLAGDAYWVKVREYIDKLFYLEPNHCRETYDNLRRSEYRCDIYLTKRPTMSHMTHHPKYIEEIEIWHD